MADFHLPYNGILGRPTLANFMAAAHYAYLTMKIPGPVGPILVLVDVHESSEQATNSCQGCTDATTVMGRHSGDECNRAARPIIIRPVTDLMGRLKMMLVFGSKGKVT